MSQIISFHKSLVFGADHAGYELKEYLKSVAEGWGVSIKDCGTNSEASVDYPDLVQPVVDEVKKGAVGVLVCGSGVGISIGANRFRGIRAALCHDHVVAKCSREHNDANILVLGSRITGQDEAVDCLKTFLETAFEGGRHQRRIEKLDKFRSDHD